MKEKFKKLPLEKKIKYTIVLILLSPMIIIGTIILLGIAVQVKGSSRQSYKYKKVIKKGLFWDTEYLIER